ncbi:hypothetical protein [Actinacidiphila oryziradicis]|uniref:hypothetical protein n=1 Tax=Actinacidiphila oryziradicis TaxID=2571141 RepID=UPI0023EFDFE3|nr:hypothetical protein [Actinacidiphila oryziradicis]MCW2869734.1 hypothetical protein [Actinacidiphila oryziradicis]
MRSFTPQVETSEISDADLDNISGGLTISGGAVSPLLGVSGGVSVDGLGEVLGALPLSLPLPLVTGGASL